MNPTALVPLLLLALKHVQTSTVPFSRTNSLNSAEVIDLCGDDDDIVVPSSSSSSAVAAAPVIINNSDAFLYEEDFMAGISNAASSSGVRVSVSVPIESPGGREAGRKRKAETEALIETTSPRFLEVAIKDAAELATKLAILDLGTIKAHLKALGPKLKDSIREHCNWNLLHEAVHTDNLAVARVLLEEFGFDPNAFDPQFGSAVYLIQSRGMAELLRDFRANLNDQRPCALYASALDSARSRGKLGLVSLVDSFSYRSAQLTAELAQSQSLAAVTKFSALRAEMFKHALSTISRRRVTTTSAQTHVLFNDLGEEGTDAGGLTVEFINLIKDAIVASKNVLVFNRDGGFYELRPDSDNLEAVDPVTQSTRSNEIRLLGYIVGLSIYHKVPLKMVFAPVMYQIMCNLNPHRDVDMMAVLKETDPDYHRSLTRLSDVTDDYVSDYAFPEVAGDHLRQWKKHRGSLESTEDFADYIPKTAKHRVYTPYAKSLAAFKIGLESAISTSIVGRHLIPAELKTLLIGELDYKAAEWRAACKASAIDPKYQQQIEWFWMAVDSVSVEERAAILKYVTALVSLPIGGFKALDHQPSVLMIDEPEKVDYLPRSSTCFNQIRLYPVSTYEKMREVLVKAATMGSAGFGDR